MSSNGEGSSSTADGIVKKGAASEIKQRTEEEPKSFSSLTERLQHLQRTEDERVGSGPSPIHELGIFARRDIQEGEMVIEYLGEIVRGVMVDVRKAIYRRKGKKCYMFNITKEVVVDATEEGNLARLTNHSCTPNCYVSLMMIGHEDRRVVLIAKTKVSTGDELTCDYMSPEVDEFDEPCLCKSANCRGPIFFSSKLLALMSPR